MNQKDSPIYATWTGIITRCNNPNHHSYKSYGGRGIKLCERWHDFDLFETDMLPTWQEGLSIERNDVNGNYCPENCRWATDAEQDRNKTTTRKFEWQGRSMILADWAAELKLPRGLLAQRIYSLGWPVERAFTAKPHRDVLTHNNQEHTLAEWSRVLGVKYITLYTRYKKYPNDLSKVLY